MMVRDKFTNSDKVSNLFRPLNIILSSFCQINGNCSVSRGGCSGISKTFSLCYLYVVFRRCILLEIMLGFSFGDKISRYLQLIQRDAFLPNTVVGVLTMPPPPPVLVQFPVRHPTCLMWFTAPKKELCWSQ